MQLGASSRRVGRPPCGAKAVVRPYREVMAAVTTSRWVACGFCASVRAGSGGRRPVSTGEAHGRLADARRRIDGIDLAAMAGLPPARSAAPERLGDRDDVRGGVVAQAYAVLGRLSNGRVPTRTARAVEGGAGVLGNAVAGLYVPPWVGGGGRIVFNVPVVAGLLAREDPSDRDAVADLVVAHERTHHLQHGLRRWQDEFLSTMDEFLAATDRASRQRPADRARATMSVVEGHASLVERTAITTLHDEGTWWRIRGRHLDRRPPGLLAGLMGVLFASKRDQYKNGMLFSAEATDLRADAARVLFGAPEGMPRSDAELEDAARWASRAAT